MSGRRRWSAYQWNILGLLTLSNLFAYMDRVNISVVTPSLIKQYHMTKPEAGLLLSAFNWAYTFALLIAGPFADWARPRLAYPLGVAIWSASTWLCGVAASVGPLAWFRGLLGVGEAPMIPAAAKVISRVYEKGDRAAVVGTFFAGNKAGLTIGTPLAAIILATFGWHAVFYTTGALSALWLVWWLPVYRENRGILPASDPGDTEERPAGVGWASLLRHRSTWGLMLGQAGYLYIYYVFVTWLPGYLEIQRHMTILKTGVVAMLPFLVAVFSTIFAGWAADRMIRRGRDVTATRKLFAVGGLGLATLFVVLAAYTRATLPAVTLLILSMGCVGLATAAVNAMPIDLAPRHIVSSLTSLQNFGGNLGGAIAPVVTGILLGATGNFQMALLVTGGVALVFGCGAYGLVVGRLDTSIGVAPEVGAH